MKMTRYFTMAAVIALGLGLGWTAPEAWAKTPNLCISKSVYAPHCNEEIVVASRPYRHNAPRKYWDGNRFYRRQDRQADRIYQGRRSGELTRRELRRLKRQQFRIEQYRRDALHDGYLSRHERRNLQQMQDRASETIYRLKHNHRTRYQHYGRHYDRYRW